MFDGIVTSLPYIRTGKLESARSLEPTARDAAAQVPTFAELGYPEIDFANWIGVVASARVPPTLAGVINRELVALAAAPGPRERLRDLGFEPADGETPEALRSCYARISSATRALSGVRYPAGIASARGDGYHRRALARMKRSSGAHHISPQIT